MLIKEMKGSNLELIVKDLNYEFELVNLARNGDNNAFKELFHLNVSQIYALCLRFSASIDLAEELTQLVFIKAWEKLNTFRKESKFSSWLHRIAVNEFLMHKRSEKRLTKIFSRTETLDSNKTLRTNGNTETHIDLERAISLLPKQARAVLVLHDIEGYKHKEISEMLNIETGTSKANLHRARKLLREKLSK
jgi:RNA polymerase sigma-70 factor (ECF subfamily)